MTQKESSIKDIDGGPLNSGQKYIGILSTSSNPCLGGDARLSELSEQAIVISI